LEVLISYAPEGEKDWVLSEYRQTEPTELVMTLADGLLYGNWPWVLKDMRK
jgi:hypothetical protein